MSSNFVCGLVVGVLVSLASCGGIGMQGPALDAADASVPADLTLPVPGACGNGNTVCEPDQLCYNGDCITVCGTNTCWQRLQAAWQMCGSL